ncbi:MAG TPA: hypothetical protein PLS71_25045, partial [Leptospiraceae bacterium]|nr:hypothetical protein [Leptospiraceae bacterium]
MSEAEEKIDLFSAEEAVIAQGNSILKNKEFTDNPLLEEYKSLLEHYRKLLNQDKKLIKISDGLQNKVKKAKNEIENLNEISRQISMSLDFDIVFGSIFEYIKGGYGFTGCCLTLVSQDKSKCKNEKFISTSEFDSLVETYTGRNYQLKFGNGPITDCILKNEVGIYHDQNIFDMEDSSHAVKNAFLMPISIAGEVIGAFSLLDNSGINLKSDEKESLKKFANHISVVIKNSKIYEDSEKARIKQLEEFNMNLTLINKSLQKFVPKDFVQFLDKENIT